MLFTPENAAKVLKGTKTQTCRPIWQHYALVVSQLDRPDGMVHIVRVMNKSRLLYEVGRRYSVQPGRTKHGIGFLQVQDMWRQPLDRMTLEQIKAEGIQVTVQLPMATPGELSADELTLAMAQALFARMWDDIYGHLPGLRYADKPEVLALKITPWAGPPPAGARRPR